MDKEKQKEREEIISHLKKIDSFFAKMDFDSYSLEDLKKFKHRWNDMPQEKSSKKK